MGDSYHNEITYNKLVRDAESRVIDKANKIKLYNKEIDIKGKFKAEHIVAIIIANWE